MDDLIYNQHKIPKEKWRYGFRTSAATGCGWIATYNALKLLGKDAEPEALIDYYQRQLPLIHGNAGTSVWGPYAYFREMGYGVKLAFRRETFDEMVENSVVCILFYRWRNKWKFGGHFVALHRTNDGIIGYNTYKTSAGPDHYGESLAEYLKKKKYYGAVLLGIRR